MPEIGDTLELEIGPVAHGGFCVARFDGQAVFVRHSLPGETVRATVTEVRPRYLRADAVEVLDRRRSTGLLLRVPTPTPLAAAVATGSTPICRTSGS